MAIENTSAPAIKESPGIRSLNEALKVFFFVLRWVMVLTVIYFLFSGVFRLKQHEIGLVLRFGKITGAPGKQVLKPGRLYWALPYPIHEVVKIDAGQIRDLTIGNFWYKESVQTAMNEEAGAQGGEGEGLAPGRDGYSLTGDVNILHFKWTASYRMKDPLQHFLNLAESLEHTDNVEACVEPFIEAAVTNSVVREANRMKIDDIRKEKQEEFKNGVARTAQTILDEMGTGVSLENLTLRINVPNAVEAAFAKVLHAEMERDGKLSNARGYRSKTIHDAEGEAAGIRGSARGYRDKIISSARADAGYIESLLKKYPKDTKKLGVYLRQYHLEVLEDVLAGVKNKYVIRSGEAGQGKLWIMLGKDPKDMEPEEEEKK